MFYFLVFIGIIGLIKRYLIIKKIIRVKEIPYYNENQISEKTKDDIIEKYGNFYLIISIIYFFLALLFRNSRYIYIVTSLSIIPILYYKWWLLKFVRYKTNDRFND